MTKIILNIDAASFRQHAEEQEGTEEDVARILREEIDKEINWSSLATAIVKGYDMVITLDLVDVYQDQSEDDG